MPCIAVNNFRSLIIWYNRRRCVSSHDDADEWWCVPSQDGTDNIPVVPSQEGATSCHVLRLTRCSPSQDGCVVSFGISVQGDAVSWFSVTHCRRKRSCVILHISTVELGETIWRVMRKVLYPRTYDGRVRF